MCSKTKSLLVCSFNFENFKLPLPSIVRAQTEINQKRTENLNISNIPAVQGDYYYFESKTNNIMQEVSRNLEKYSIRNNYNTNNNNDYNTNSSNYTENKIYNFGYNNNNGGINNNISSPNTFPIFHILFKRKHKVDQGKLDKKIRKCKEEGRINKKCRGLGS